MIFWINREVRYCVHVIGALFEEEAERFGEHVAGEVDGGAVVLRVAVARRGRHHALAEVVVGAADLRVGYGHGRHLLHQVGQLLLALGLVGGHRFDAGRVPQVICFGASFWIVDLTINVIPAQEEPGSFRI